MHVRTHTHTHKHAHTPCARTHTHTHTHTHTGNRTHEHTDYNQCLIYTTRAANRDLAEADEDSSTERPENVARIPYTKY